MVSLLSRYAEVSMSASSGHGKKKLIEHEVKSDGNWMPRERKRGLAGEKARTIWSESMTLLTAPS